MKKKDKKTNLDMVLIRIIARCSYTSWIRQDKGEGEGE